MEYKIQIEGAFTGIPKEYKGERILGEGERELLLNALKGTRPNNQQLRDGLKYHVELKDDKGIFTAEFDEGNLPPEIRKFIDRILQSNKKL